MQTVEYVQKEKNLIIEPVKDNSFYNRHLQRYQAGFKKENKEK